MAAVWAGRKWRAVRPAHGRCRAAEEVVTLAPLRPAIHVTLLTSSGSPLLAARPRAASRFCRAAAPAPALPAACLTLAWTEKTSIRRVRGGRPHHLLMRRREEQAAPGRPGVRPGEHQGGCAAGVDELHARQIDDDRPLAARGRRAARGFGHVKLAGNATTARPSRSLVCRSMPAIWSAFLLQQQGEGSTQRLVRQFSPGTLRRTRARALAGRCPVTAPPARSAGQRRLAGGARVRGPASRPPAARAARHQPVLYGRLG